MNEWDKAQAGYLYDANYDKEIIESRIKLTDCPKKNASALAAVFHP